jgi:hypothetical protein
LRFVVFKWLPVLADQAGAGAAAVDQAGRWTRLAAVDDREQLVTVAVVGPRRDVYRNLSL